MRLCRVAIEVRSKQAVRLRVELARLGLVAFHLVVTLVTCSGGSLALTEANLKFLSLPISES